MCEVTKDFFIKNIKRYAHASCIKNDFPELYNNITQNYPNTQFMEALWLYYEGLDENSKPSCPLCGKTLKFDKFTIGYKAFCSKKCAQKGSRKKACQTMIEKYGGRPVGIDTLATTVGEEVETIEDVYEPYLIQIGFISRTIRGRIPLPAAYAHMGYEMK